MAFQVIVDGNLDNADMDYTGKYAAATSLQLGKGHRPGRHDAQ